MLIEELVQGINIENEENEFKGIIKEGLNEKKDDRLENSWLKEIVGFANAKGGSLYVGVDNKSHEILALSHHEVDKIILMVHRLIKERIEPQINYFISTIDVPFTSPTRYLIKISIPKSNYLPVYLKYHSYSFVFIRHFGKTAIASPEEIRDLVLSSEKISFDQPFTDLIYRQEDFKLLHECYENYTKKKLQEKELISIGFISIDHHLSKGATLFLDNYNDSRTLVECTQFLGFSKGDNVFYANKTISANLLKEYFLIQEFITSRSANGYIKNESGRSRLLSYPLRALNEGIINALVHRNYFISGGQIEINLYKDRLEIISPGSLPGSRYLNKETNLSSIPPLRRNEVICNVFTMLGLMEKKGSGFDKIEDEYARYDQKYAPYISCDNSFFSLTLPDLSFDGVFANLTTPKVYVNEELTIKNALQILSFCYNSSKSIKEITDYLKIQPSSYFRKNVIDYLVKKEFLKQDYSAKIKKYYANHDKVFPIL